MSLLERRPSRLDVFMVATVVCAAPALDVWLERWDRELPGSHGTLPAPRGKEMMPAC